MKNNVVCIAAPKNSDARSLEKPSESQRCKSIHINIHIRKGYEDPSRHDLRRHTGIISHHIASTKQQQLVIITINYIHATLVTCGLACSDSHIQIQCQKQGGLPAAGTFDERGCFLPFFGDDVPAGVS